MDVQQALEKKNSVLFLKYRDLILYPKNSLKFLCKEVEISYSDQMLSYYESAHDNIASKNKGKVMEWHKETSKPINKENVDKWKMELEEEDIKYIEHILEYEMETFEFKNIY